MAELAERKEYPANPRLNAHSHLQLLEVAAVPLRSRIEALAKLLESEQTQDIGRLLQEIQHLQGLVGEIDRRLAAPTDDEVFHVEVSGATVPLVGDICHYIGQAFRRGVSPPAIELQHNGGWVPFFTDKDHPVPLPKKIKKIIINGVQQP